MHAPICGFTPTSFSRCIAGVRGDNACALVKSAAKFVVAAESFLSLGSMARGTSAQGCGVSTGA